MNNNINIASIDIGSNTVLLLIARLTNDELTPLINRYRSPRLGTGLKINGDILEERIDELLDILSEYKKLIVEYNCTKTIITATNAMRIAANSNKIVARIKNDLDLDVQIIHGNKEAKLSYLGASSSLPQINEKVVIDIGGGSTEIIYGNTNEIKFKHSFQTGVVSLTEQFLQEFPYSENALKNVDEHLNEVFSLIDNNIPTGLPTIAVAGTPTTLSCIKQGLKDYDEEKVENSVLNRKDISDLYNQLSILKGTDIKLKFGDVVSGREDVLFSGLLILKHLADRTSLDIINVSSRGVRYGNIINYLL